MRFQILSFAGLTTFLHFITPSLTASSDILNIQKLTADYSVDVDTKNFNGLDSKFTANATLDPGKGVFSTGLPDIKAALAAVLADNLTLSSITTSSISLPFDIRGPSKASAIQYVIGTFLGKDPVDEGKAFFLYGVFKDKFVKTRDYGNYGGWKFSERALQILVSFLMSWFFCPRKKKERNRKVFGKHILSHGYWAQKFTVHY